jgi:hypothetical protein
VDITEVILFQHVEQRRMFAVLDELDRSDTDALEAVWRRLAIFLEVHAEAEERYFYPRLLEVGRGAGGEDSASEETEDAIKDHNKIRDAIAEADRHPVGSDEWWSGVLKAREENSDHMAEEEREDLPDFRLHADLQARHDIAVRFLVFEAQHAASGVEPKDKDPEEYVKEHEPG